MEFKSYTVKVKTSSQWEEFHNTLLSSSSVSHIPDREVTCSDDKKHSSTRGTYLLTDDEAEDLREHHFVDWIELCPTCNPDSYPKPEPAARRFRKNIKVYRDLGSNVPTGIDGFGSVYFDGDGDSLSTADNADFDFGTGDFTIEFFANNDLAQSSNPVLIGASGGWYVQFKTGGTILEFYTGSTAIQATGLSLEGAWHHIAVTKESNSVKIFVDGVLQSTTSNSDTINLANTLYIGSFGGGSLHYLGYISNVRIVKGTALYTSNFTPPTEPLENITNTSLLVCNSSSDATAEATGKTVTVIGGAAPKSFHPGFYKTFPYIPDTLTPAVTGSVDFDGAGDYLLIPNDPSFQFGAEEFTIECWIYRDDSNSGQLFFAKGTNHTTTPSDCEYALYAAGSNLNFRVSFNGSSFTDITTSGGLTPGQWTHVAVVRENTSTSLFKIFINGVLNTTGNYSAGVSIAPQSVPFRIAATDGGSAFNGKISNFRVRKGKVLYTSNFTPPTEELEATYPGITGSVAFDGTGDYLSLTDSTEFDVGLSNEPFTAELWTYPRSINTSVNLTLFGRGGGSAAWNSTSGHQYLLFLLNDLLYFQWWNGTSLVSMNTSSGDTLTLNQWSHLAVVYDGTNVKVYRNGLEILSSSSTTFGKPSSSNITRVGTQPASGSTWDGYISNVRLVRGTPLYTSNFTPPTQELDAISTPNLVANGTFDTASSIDDWVADNSTVAWDSGNQRLSITRSGGSGLTAYLNISTEVGKTYTLRCDFTGPFSGNGNTLNIVDGAGITNSMPAESVIVSTTVGTNTTAAVQLTFTALSTTSNIRITIDNSGQTIYLDNLVVQEYETALLCCQSPTDATEEATGKTITVNGDAAPSFVSPGLTTGEQENVSLLCCQSKTSVTEEATDKDITAFGDPGISTESPGLLTGGFDRTYNSPEVIRTNWAVKRVGLATNGDFWTGTNDLAPEFTDIGYNMTGKNVDIIIQDSGVLQYHPEFMYGRQSRVRDIVLDGPLYLDPTSSYLQANTYTKADGRIGITTTAAHNWWNSNSSGYRSADFETSVTTGSVDFDGTSDYLTFSSGFTMGTGDFTVECFAYTRVVNQRMEVWINGGNIGGFYLSTGFNALDAGPILNRASPPGNGWTLGVSGPTLTSNTWHHIAWVRESGIVSMYIDGVKHANTLSNSNDTGIMESIGGWSNGEYSLDAIISNVRVRKGVALYTTTFTPPTEELEATFPGVVGSVDFNGGDDDYLTVDSGADFAFGTGDFTVECFVYQNTQGSFDYLIDGRNGSQTTGTWSLSHGYSSGTTLQFGTSSSALLTCPSGSQPGTNTWYHVAVSRSGTSLKMFIDGVQVDSATNSTDFSTSPTISYIGTRYSTEHSLDGFISNVRIVKGTAIYTSNFTVPTAELTAVTGTSLLCCQSGLSATLEATDKSITVNGNVVASTENPGLTGNRSYDASLLCCQSPTDATEEATGKTITVNGNAVASSENPGLTIPGTGTKDFGTIAVSSTYTVNRSIGESLDGSSELTSGHGTACAGLAAGKNMGIAFDANIWNMSGIGEPSSLSITIEQNYDLMKVFTKYKPVNPETGIKNPTIVNGSWGYQAGFGSADTVNYKFRGVTGSFIGNAAVTDQVTAMKDGLNNQVNGALKSWSSSSRSTSTDTAANEFMTENPIYVAAAGNNNQRLGIGVNDPDRLNYMDDDYFNVGDPRAEFPGVATPCNHRDWMNPQGIGFNSANDFHPVICVGAMNDEVTDLNGYPEEYKASYSNNGPGIDVWAPADETLTPGIDVDSTTYVRYDDTRFYDRYFNGTSAAAPVTTGVLALYLQSNPRATQKQVKRWSRKSGSKVSSYFFDRNTDDSQTSYWTDSFNLRGSEKRILFNPYYRSPDAPNVPNISISGVSFNGISISNQ